MGSECARAFRECPVDHWSMKKQHTVEEKRCLALKHCEDIRLAIVPLITRVNRTHKLDMTKIFLQNLHFINDWFKEFNEEYAGKMWVQENIKYRRHTFYPRFLHSYQQDCRALLADIREFVNAVKPYLFSCRNVVALNKYIRWTHTITFYFHYMKKKHPEFHDKPPQNIKQIANSYPEPYYIPSDDDDDDDDDGDEGPAN